MRDEKVTLAESLGKAIGEAREGISPVASDIPHLGQVGLSANPIAIAKKGAEKYALNDYGKMLLDRANNAGEEVK